MRIESQPAYILHTRNYRDTSLIVDFLTVDFGRVSGVIKGARSQSKSAKQRRSLIQPFNPLLISWLGNSELKTITQYEARVASIPLQGVRLFSGLYVNELMTRLIQPYDEHAELYALYQWVLDGLLREPLIDVVLRHFELQLLDYLGYGVHLTIASDTGEAIRPEQPYQYIPEQGFSAVSIPASDDRPAVLRSRVYRGEDLLAIAKGDFTDHTRRVAKYLCRSALKPYLGTKPLKSRELFS